MKKIRFWIVKKKIDIPVWLFELAGLLFTIMIVRGEFLRKGEDELTLLLGLSSVLLVLFSLYSMISLQDFIEKWPEYKILKAMEIIKMEPAAEQELQVLIDKNDITGLGGVA